MNKQNNITGMVIFLMTMPIFLLATEKDTAVYFARQNGKQMEAGRSDYVAKRWQEDSLWHVQVFSYPQQRLLLDGRYDDIACTKKEGLFLDYYPDGMMKDSGLYVANKEEGLHCGWYEAGEPSYFKHYKHGFLVDTSVSYFKNGTKSMLTVADDKGTGLQEEYHDNGKIRAKGRFISGKRTGQWVFTDNNQIVSQEVVYDNDSAVIITNYDEKGVKQDNSNNFVERAAKFPGGLDGWRRFLERNLLYPERAMRNRVQGIIRISIIVDKDGKVTNSKVLGDPDPDLSKEALRIMSISPKWIPAIQNNRLVTYRFVQTITFQLQ